MPNLLIIHTDQQSSWTLSSYGGTLIETPNIDRVGREGAIFQNFFTNSAVCTPSRGCFLTGRYPHAHGAYRNNIPLNRDELTIAYILQKNGYETGYAGKWHLDGTPRPGWIHPARSMGFEDCRYMFNRGHWKKIEEMPMEASPMVFPYKVIGDEKTFTTDWLATKTIEFIEKQRQNPFFFMVSIPDPHGPYTVRAPYDTTFSPEDMPIPSTFRQENMPDWAEAARNRGYSLDKSSAEELLRERKAHYCGEVKCIDYNVGRILDCLEKEGILDDTIVVFTTDHGDYMGEHGLTGKNNLYETAYRIPLLIRWSQKIPSGTEIDNIVSTVDFQQTILGLMGVEPSGREQGFDASSLLVGENTEWQDEAFIHHSSFQRAGLFTPQYELAYVKDSDHILFDRVNDTEQVNNLFHDPGYKKVINELTERIIRHHIEVDSPAIATDLSRRWLKELR